jgi:hypothetical protein
MRCNVEIPATILATYLVSYDTEDMPEDIDIDTALDMIKSDLSDTYPNTEPERWFLSDTDGKPFTK